MRGHTWERGRQIGKPREDARRDRATARLVARKCGAIDEERCVLGSIARSEALSLNSRHLGLVQAAEMQNLEAFMDKAAQIVGSSIDLDMLAAVARPIESADVTPVPLPALGKKIAIACACRRAMAAPSPPGWLSPRTASTASWQNGSGSSTPGGATRSPST